MLTGHVDVRETRALLLAIGGVILAVGLTSRASSALHWDRTHIEIAPGVSMPLLHLGWGNHTRWIASGGRGLDTAYDYGDVRQQDLGKALRGSGIDRSELFVCAAVWPIQCPRPSSQGTRVAPLLTGTVQRDPWRMHMRAYHRAGRPRCRAAHRAHGARRRVRIGTSGLRSVLRKPTARCSPRAT